MDCLFCKIMDGEIPSKTIYEDDIVKVFLDINPNSNGHCLIVPKKHVVTIEDIDNELVIHIMGVEKQIHRILKEKLNIEGLTIIQNNDLGQEVKHYHVHLIPRYQNDNIKISYNNNCLRPVDDVYNSIKN